MACWHRKIKNNQASETNTTLARIVLHVNATQSNDKYYLFYWIGTYKNMFLLLNGTQYARPKRTYTIRRFTLKQYARGMTVSPPYNDYPVVFNYFLFNFNPFTTLLNTVGINIDLYMIKLAILWNNSHWWYKSSCPPDAKKRINGKYLSSYVQWRNLLLLTPNSVGKIVGKISLLFALFSALLTQ